MNFLEKYQFQCKDESNKLTKGSGLAAPQKSVILAPKIHNSKSFRAKNH